MKKIKLLVYSLLLPVGLLVGSTVFGATTYNRSPAGASITSPVSFNITLDTFNGVFGGCFGDKNYWGISVYDHGNEIEYYSEAVSSTTLSHIFVMTLPVADDYNYVTGVCSGDNVLSGTDNWYHSFEGTSSNGATIFAVINPPAGLGYKIVTTKSGFASSTLAIAGRLFTDISPMTFAWIGLVVGFLVIEKAIAMVVKKKNRVK
jgi:hypothetical protein